MGKKVLVLASTFQTEGGLSPPTKTRFGLAG
jgi:hypothetical protein